VLFVIGANIPLWGGTSVGTAVAPLEAAVVGDVGLFLFVGAIVAYILIYVYKELSKPDEAPQPSPPAVQNP
jgi:hypothetical protein